MHLKWLIIVNELIHAYTTYLLLFLMFILSNTLFLFISMLTGCAYVINTNKLAMEKCKLKTYLEAGFYLVQQEKMQQHATNNYLEERDCGWVKPLELDDVDCGWVELLELYDVDFLGRPTGVTKDTLVCSAVAAMAGACSQRKHS